MSAPASSSACGRGDGTAAGLGTGQLDAQHTQGSAVATNGRCIKVVVEREQHRLLRARWERFRPGSGCQLAAHLDAPKLAMPRCMVQGAPRAAAGSCSAVSISTGAEPLP